MNEFTPQQYEEAGQELRNWLRNSDASNFSALLFVLITKADSSNKYRLRIAFPHYVHVFEDWHRSENPEEFLARFPI